MIYQITFQYNLRRESIRLSRCMLYVPSWAVSFALGLLHKRVTPSPRSFFSRGIRSPSQAGVPPSAPLVPRSLYFFFEYDSGTDTYDQLARQHSPEVSLDSEQGDGCEYAADPDEQSEGVDEEGISRFVQTVDDA